MRKALPFSGVPKAPAQDASDWSTRSTLLIAQSDSAQKIPKQATTDKHGLVRIGVDVWIHEDAVEIKL